MSVCCEMSGHRDQIKDYPVGTVVENTVALAAASGAVPIGSRGSVTSHCDDGRAWVFFDGKPEGHTFHGPDKYLRVISKPQNFASVATIRAAIFDVIDGGNPRSHLWYFFDSQRGITQSTERANEDRVDFVDLVVMRLAELQSPPHDGVKLENLCPRHRRECLPAPTAKVCSMCEAERKDLVRNGVPR